MSLPKGTVFPITAKVNSRGHLEVGGCDVVDLIAEYGSPLYLFDEATLRNRCRAFLDEFGLRYSNTRVLYASKAYISVGLARLFQEEGLGLDVVSGGELAVARAAGVGPEAVYFHGNNKGLQELREALEWDIGRVVVDGLYELELLNRLAREMGRTQEILLRISPGVDPHTHAHTTTGILDSKFGFPLQTGQAAQAVQKAMKARNLRLVGLHCHLGSPLFETEPYVQAINLTLEFASQMREEGLELREFSPGGGFAIAYLETDRPPSVAAYADAIVPALKEGCASRGMTEPLLTIEPGRAIVGPAGVAVYTAGAIKEIPGVRQYVAVDGGMGDNIRPALYDAKYEAILANKVDAAPASKVTIAGKFCESGDILVWDVTLPQVEGGDLVAIPASGAYCLSMASNYNLVPRLPVLLVKGGQAQMLRRRETYEDLLRCDTV